MVLHYQRCLIADIGGTYTRLALFTPDAGINQLMQIVNDEYPQLDAALQAYIEPLPSEQRPDAALIAVAGPVTGDHIKITNRDWAFSIREYRSAFGWQFLQVVNDFAAVALAISSLKPEDYLPIGKGSAVPDRAVGIVGPGTGLGVSFLIPDRGRWIPVSSEGGHVTLAAADEEEEQVIAIVRRRLGHVSAERLLSGPGLPVLYQAIAEREGGAHAALLPNEIILRDEQGKDPIASRTIDMFLAMLGTVAANLAVTISAEGGIYFAGGILPRIRQRMINSRFRERFITHDLYRSWLDRIPTRLIVKEHVALDGLRNYLSQIDS